ncbi:MAG: sulfotransferase [Alphaproteobacteria bacterium]
MAQRRATDTRDRRSKLPLVYILSTGRSGSTLLDVLLGAQPECWTLGEFQLLDIGVGQQLPCGCLSPLGQCDFWSPILERVRRSMRFPIGYFRSGRHPSGKVVRWPLLPSILTGGPLPTQRAIADAYASSNLRALEEVKEAAEAHQDQVSWLIDASKDPYRLLWLQASGHFDIRVIHLVRRPEGFVANMMRSAGAEGTGAVIKYAGRWLVDNLIGVALLWRMFWPEAVKRVRYEDLAADPEGTLGAICAWLQVPFDAERVHSTRFDVNHGVAGNRPRWEELPVTFTESWRATMPPLHMRLVSLVTAPLVRLWRRSEAADGWEAGGPARRRPQPRWLARGRSPS